MCVHVCDCDASSPVRMQAGSCGSCGRNICLGLRVVLGLVQASRNDFNCRVGPHASGERLCSLCLRVCLRIFNICGFGQDLL